MKKIKKILMTSTGVLLTAGVSLGVVSCSSQNQQQTDNNSVNANQTNSSKQNSNNNSNAVITTSLSKTSNKAVLNKVFSFTINKQNGFNYQVNINGQDVYVTSSGNTYSFTPQEDGTFSITISASNINNSKLNQTQTYPLTVYSAPTIPTVQIVSNLGKNNNVQCGFNASDTSTNYVYSNHTINVKIPVQKDVNYTVFAQTNSNKQQIYPLLNQSDVVLSTNTTTNSNNNIATNNSFVNCFYTPSTTGNFQIIIQATASNNPSAINSTTYSFNAINSSTTNSSNISLSNLSSNVTYAQNEMNYVLCNQNISFLLNNPNNAQIEQVSVQNNGINNVLSPQGTSYSFTPITSGTFVINVQSINQDGDTVVNSYLFDAINSAAQIPLPFISALNNCSTQYANGVSAAQIKAIESSFEMPIAPNGITYKIQVGVTGSTLSTLTSASDLSISGLYTIQITASLNNTQLSNAITFNFGPLTSNSDIFNWLCTNIPQHLVVLNKLSISSNTIINNSSLFDNCVLNAIQNFLMQQSTNGAININNNCAPVSVQTIMNNISVVLPTSKTLTTTEQTYGQIGAINLKYQNNY